IVPVDNFNTSVRVDNSQNYAFQALATNMRGFIQNVRNGNSFALINSEIRIPIFQYLISRPIRSDFVRNFQTVAFADIGTAWTGSSPYADDNALNVQDIQSGPFTITLNKQIEPVVAGYGFGLRSRIFGYFMRGSWAWGYEDGEITDNIFYFSLGLDF
ncbi:MAG: BamA/TamA family outer membrane protein, partial [Bacteroidia bacterium]|nr:BamA/TamA family outer membrane protein [Bacteroidia bacterium]